MKACPKCGKRFLGNEEFCPSDGQTLMELDNKTIEDPLVGTTIDGRYQIEKKLGEGGMGVVYLATHAVIGSRCALKILRGEFAGEGEVSQRFIQEARAAAAIGNDHIIQITDFGQLPDGSAYYFVMEYLDGQSLSDAIQSSVQIPPDRVVSIVSQCCEALAAAHSADIVHRDLKPDNIFLINKGNRTDFVKILDFGIAKVQSGDTGKRLTKTGVIFGTPQYMAPEQAAGTNADARTDIYALGIIMYEMLCGRVPFEADTFMGVLTKHLYEEPIPPRRLVPTVDVPQNLEAVLLKMITKKPDRRYQSMAELEQDLRAIAEGRTPEIVYDQMRDLSTTSIPPMSPAEVVGAKLPRARTETRPVQKPKWPLFAGIGTVVVGGAIAAILLAGGGGSANDGAQRTGSDAPSKRGTVAVPAAGKPIEKASTASGDAPREQTVPETASVVQVTSMPAGADLYQGDTLIGKLPFNLVKPEKGEAPVVYTVKLRGFQDAEISVSVDTAEMLPVTLEKAKRDDKVKPGGTGAPADSAKPGSGKKGAGSPADKGKKKDDHTDLADPWG